LLICLSVMQPVYLNCSYFSEHLFDTAGEIVSRL
jgi:hypothetical protein